MNCTDVRHLLDPYSDGELDLVRQMEIEEHLSGCAQCAEQEANLRSLRAAIAAPRASLYYRAPAGFRARLESTLQPAPIRRPRRILSFSGMAAGILLLIGVVAILASRKGTATEDRLAESVVASHVRSLQVAHLRDVVSTDKHTVKPWFQNQAKLDFSPEVPDLTGHGYPLTGGRMDYLADRPVAALVYERRAHIINLFIWPAADDNEQAVRSFARQGYHVRHWQRSGMTYWAISDLNDQDLDEFVRLYQAE